LFADIFFIGGRAACEDLAEDSKDSINLGVTHARWQLLQNLCLLIRCQLNTTMPNITKLPTVILEQDTSRGLLTYHGEEMQTHNTTSACMTTAHR